VRDFGLDTQDAVILASPGFAHAEQLFACLEHEKPVLCEKPLTMDAASSLRVVEAEHKAGRSLIQVGFMRRFDPEYAALKQLLDSGELGRTLLLHNVHRNKSVPATFRSEMIVRDSLVHEVDVARWLFDDEITRITVHAPKPTSLVGEGVLDPQLAVFELANGAIADVEVFVNFQVGYEV
jgi:myo-inositol 2-dehydrogenase/D-chiro-inositol 1-dehydrogenase